MFLRKKILLLSILLISTIAFAQKTNVTGTVYEDSTVQRLSFVKLFFKGTQVGTTTDSLGYFELSISSNQLKKDTIVVSYLGYKTQQIPIQKGVEQNIDIHLQSSLFLQLDEVTAVAGENVAWRYLRRIIANKEKNNSDNLASYSSEEYSKVRFDLNNFTDKIKKNIILRPFDYIWENTNTTEDGVNYLPVLMTETYSKHYHQSHPKKDKSIIVGEKTDGFAGPNLVKFMNDLYFTPNIYNNYLVILDKSFPSPLNDNYKNNYKFYIMDSVASEMGKNYKMRFVPKNPRELAFSGEMYFDSASYAITEINLRFDIQANINFVRSYYITQKYKRVDSVHYILKESSVLGDFTILENASDLTGFFGRKRAIYSNYSINQPINPSIFKGIEKVAYADSSLQLTDSAWNALRTEELSATETRFLQLDKQLKQDKAYIAREKIFYTLGESYFPLGAVQLGNVFSSYSYNFVEHSRVKLGFRTNPENTFPVRSTFYGAYGFLDEKFKYGLQTDWNITPNRYATRIGVNYKYDIEQLGRSYNQMAIDNILSSFVQLGGSVSRNYSRRFASYFQKEIVTGLVGRIAYFHQAFAPTGTHSYLEKNESFNEVTAEKYDASGMQFTLKFSYLNKLLSGKFYDKEDLEKSFRKFPDVHLQYTYSDTRNFSSNFDYQKVKVSIRQYVRANKLGYFNYSIEGGLTQGTVPYLFLDIPFGNQLLINDAYAFNLMEFIEFVGDSYINLQFAHHFDGLLLNRMPLINRLKWRSFLFGKTYLAQLSPENRNGNYLLPEGTIPIQEPYYEVGFGVENIFKIAKIDFIWRLSPAYGSGTYYTFLVKPSFQFRF